MNMSPFIGPDDSVSDQHLTPPSYPTIAVETTVAQRRPKLGSEVRACVEAGDPKSKRYLILHWNDLISFSAALQTTTNGKVYRNMWARPGSL